MPATTSLASSHQQRMVEPYVPTGAAPLLKVKERGKERTRKLPWRGLHGFRRHRRIHLGPAASKQPTEVVEVIDEPTVVTPSAPSRGAFHPTMMLKELEKKEEGVRGEMSSLRQLKTARPRRLQPSLRRQALIQAVADPAPSLEQRIQAASLREVVEQTCSCATAPSSSPGPTDP